MRDACKCWLHGPRERGRLGDLGVGEKMLNCMLENYVFRMWIVGLPYSRVSGVVLRSR